MRGGRITVMVVTRNNRTERPSSLRGNQAKSSLREGTREREVLCVGLHWITS